MLLEVGALVAVLPGRLVGQGVLTPDLAVGMGVGAAHDLPFVLEDLHPAVALPQFRRLSRPDVHHLAD